MCVNGRRFPCLPGWRGGTVHGMWLRTLPCCSWGTWAREMRVGWTLFLSSLNSCPLPTLNLRRWYQGRKRTKSSSHGGRGLRYLQQAVRERVLSARARGRPDWQHLEKMAMAFSGLLPMSSLSTSTMTSQIIHHLLTPDRVPVFSDSVPV